MKGRKCLDETKRKLSIIKKRIGIIPPSRKGCKHTEESKRKMSESRRGVNANSWKGGITFSKEYYRKKCLERYARKYNATGSHTMEEWDLLKRQYGNRCPCCGKNEPEVKLCEDHIIPLSKGGSDWIENIQPLCFSCNSKKHTKIIKYYNGTGN